MQQIGNMSASMTYNDLKASPLGKGCASPEEIAIWLDMQKFSDSNGIKSLMNVIERNYCTKADWNDLNLSSRSHGASTGSMFKPLWVQAFEERPSSIILRNLFVFMFKTSSLSEKDIDQLTKFFKKKIDSIKSKRKKIACKIMNKCHFLPSSNNYSITRLDKLFEVYAEMHDRLCKLKMHEITNA